MWTPRRVGLLVLGLLILGAGFVVYSLFLGGYDGLPALPPGYATPAPADTKPPSYPVPTTVERLQQAFGSGSPEGGSDVRTYKHRLPITGRNGVMAIGPPATDGSPRVVVAPVSVALFGAPTVRLKAGEQVEITTLHADRAVITFDRDIHRIEDMSTAKMARLELESDPDDDPRALAEVKRDPRKGRIWVTTNRKSVDPADHLVLRTPGPLFVQLPDEAVAESPDTKHIWTAAAVEVFDRKNLPRRVRARADALARLGDQPPPSAVGELIADEPIPPVAAAVSADDLRQHNAVADILTGRTLPPPTAVGRGMEVYLAQAKKATAGGKQAANSFAGVRQMVLGDGVVMCLWTDGSAGLPGAPTPPSPAPAVTSARPPSPNADPPLGSLAVGGGLIDAGTLADRLERRSLLVITTPGAFRYDLEKNLASYDAAALPPEGGQNFVVVTRLNARNQTDYVICSKLTLDLNDPDQGKEKKPAADGGGLVIRQMTATGPQVYISVQADGLEASCVELVHTQDPKAKRSVTTLRGTPDVPVIAKHSGSKLTAGDPATAAVVTLTSADPPAGAADPRRVTTVSVAGPGRLELVDRDPDTGALKSSVAQWAKRLDHEKYPQGKQTLDLFKFQENAAFVDAASSMSLRATDIWVWVGKAAPKPGDPKPGESSVALGGSPEKLVATADVHLDSTDLVVRKTNKLTVWFSDITPPKPAPEPAKPAAVEPKPPAPVVPVTPPVGPVAPAPLPVPIPPPAKPAEPAPEPIPNPIQLQADTVEAWMGRYPVAPPPPDPKAVPPAKPPQPKTKYDLLKARCDDNVRVHQDPDPNDPAKPANGLDITGNKLILENSPPAGSVLTVTGGRGADGWAMVAFEDTVIYGPAVVIDQPNNTASVAGRGRLRSLTGTDLAGNELSSPTDLVVDWSERMKFEGAKAFAVFVGGVVVQQEAKGDKAVKPVRAAPLPEVIPVKREELPPPRDAGPHTTATTLTHLWCHQLDLTLDRPVYFNQLRKDDRNKAGRGSAEPKPKVQAAVAVPLADADVRRPDEKYVVFREQAVAPTGEVLKARMLTARQMDFANKSKQQELYATGPGELRLLQPANSDDEKGKGPDKGTPKEPGKEPAKGVMKLTVVNFRKTMTAIDQGNGLYQEATFEKGGVVLRTPTTDLMLALEAHALPTGSDYLRSEDELVVSSARAKKEADPDQRLTARGNAEFRDDNRTGLGDKIVFDGTRVTLEAGLGRMAALHSNKRAVNQQQSMRAKKFIYNSVTGVVELTESSGGTLIPGK